MGERENKTINQKSNNSFVFYQSFSDAIKCLPKENQLYAYQYITEYALQWVLPDANEDSVAYAIFLMAKPQIDANINRRINGSKWWAKPWNQNARKNRDTVDNWEKQLKQPTVDLENDQKQPNVNVNVNDNVNVKENVKRKFLDYVYLSDEEYKKISDRYWESVLKDFIERLDNRIWINPHAKNRQDRDHYRTILQRIKKEWIKEHHTKKQLSEFEIEEWVYDLEKLNAFNSYPT